MWGGQLCRVLERHLSKRNRPIERIEFHCEYEGRKRGCDSGNSSLGQVGAFQKKVSN